MRRWSLAALLTAVVLAGGAAAQDLTNNGQNFQNTYGEPNRDLVNTVVGEPYADVMGTSITIQRQFRKALPSIYSYSQTAHYQNRADAGAAGEAYASVAGEAVPVCPTTMCAPGSRWVMWDVPFYVRETQKPTDGDLGYSTIASGFATGVSRMLGDNGAIGFAVGYDARKMTQKDGYHFRNRADTLHLALYGGTNIGSFFLDGYAGWSRAWNRMEREIVQTGVGRRELFKANYRDDVYSAGLKLSRVFILPNDARITPSLGVDLSHVRMDGISERNHFGAATYLLESGKSSYTSVALPLMVSLNKTFASDVLTFKGAPSLWTPELRAGYVPILGNKRADVDFKFANNAAMNWTTKSAKFAGSYGTAGAGLKMKLADKYIFAVDYDITLGKKYRNHAFTAMYGVSF